MGNKISGQECQNKEGLARMEEDFLSAICSDLKNEIATFLKSGDSHSHQIILEKLNLNASAQITFRNIETLFGYLSIINDIPSEVFIASGIKSLIKCNYSVFSSKEKVEIYKLCFQQYQTNCQQRYFMQDLICVIFKYFYESIVIETSLLEDVKQFCESSIGHLQLGLQLFQNIVDTMQDYIFDSNSKNITNIQKGYSLSQYSKYSNKTNTFHRRREIQFRQNTLPLIFDIPFQLLNSKKEYLIDESENNYSVLSSVLKLLIQCLNYDYFDQKKVSDNKFVNENSILSIPCREKKQEPSYLNDLRSQEFTNILFELYYFMVNKQPSIAASSLTTLSLLTRLSIKFFKKEDQKFQQMIFIIDGLHKIMQSHTFIFDESLNSQNIEHKEVQVALCTFISKIPIGISFSDAENLTGFWEFIVEVQTVTNKCIENKNWESLELLLEFWCGYDYFLGHDGAIKQEQLREIVEEILKDYIEQSSQSVRAIFQEEEIDQFYFHNLNIIDSFSRLSNSWIDQIEKHLMQNISKLLDEKVQISTSNFQYKNKKKNFQIQIDNQFIWNLQLLFKAQSYNLKEELNMTNKHFELNSQEEINEDIDILNQAFDSFGKLFQITLNLHKQFYPYQDFYQSQEFQQQGNHSSQQEEQLLFKIIIFLVDELLGFKNNIQFDYLQIIDKFTQSIELAHYSQLNHIINAFLCQYLNYGKIDLFIQLLQAISKHLHSNEQVTIQYLKFYFYCLQQGVMIGCFPFDIQKFFESSIISKYHKDGLLGGSRKLQNCYLKEQYKEESRIYECLFNIVDQYVQYQKHSLNHQFQQLVLKQSNKQNVVINTVQVPTAELLKRSFSDSQRASNSENTTPFRDNNQNQNDNIESQSQEIIDKQTQQHSDSTLFHQIANSNSNKTDYFDVFMGSIKERIREESLSSMQDQKVIFRSVLNQLIGVLRSSSIYTYQQLVDFILDNNIFFAINHILQQSNDSSNQQHTHKNTIQDISNNVIEISSNMSAQSQQQIIIDSHNSSINSNLQSDLMENNNQNHPNINSSMISSYHNDIETNTHNNTQKLSAINRSQDILEQQNAYETNVSLKLVCEITVRRQYIPKELETILMQNIIDVILNLQQKILSPSYIKLINAQNEYELLIIPLQYEYKTIYQLIFHSLLDLSQLNHQLIISNMFHSLRLISPESISAHTSKLYFIYKSISILASHHFHILLLLEPEQFYSLQEIMLEALKTIIDGEDALNFFVSLMKEIINSEQTESQKIKCLLGASMKILKETYSSIVNTILRRDDINPSHISQLMLGFHWVLGKDNMLQIVNDILEQSSHLTIEFQAKFQNYEDQIEVLDQYKSSYAEQTLFLQAKIIFKRIFVS